MKCPVEGLPYRPLSDRDRDAALRDHRGDDPARRKAGGKSLALSVTPVVMLEASPHLRRCRSPEDREEILGAALLGLAKAVAVYDPALGKLTTCASVYVRTEIRNHYRRTRRQVGGFDRPEIRTGVRLERGDGRPGDFAVDAAVDRGDGPALEAETADGLLRLDAAIERLPERTRLVMRRRLAGDRAEAIAADLGLGRCRVNQIEAEARRAVAAKLLDLPEVTPELKRRLRQKGRRGKAPPVPDRA